MAVPHEAREYQGDRAGFVSRVIANGIDVVVAAVVVAGLYVGVVALAVVLNPTRPSVPSTPFVLFVLALGAVLWLSFAVAWATTGRTIGARVMGLRVVNFRGRRLTPVGAALRASFCLAFLPGIFWVVVSGQNRSLQDTVMRTQVIYDWTRRPEIGGS
jgi:uncharacterized RDD family membrane protein YckC